MGHLQQPPRRQRKFVRIAGTSNAPDDADRLPTLITPDLRRLDLRPAQQLQCPIPPARLRLRILASTLENARQHLHPDTAAAPDIKPLHGLSILTPSDSKNRGGNVRTARTSTQIPAPVG